MLLLLGVAFVAGVVTAISPCVLPVLPVLLAGGTAGTNRRPFAIVAGLVASFTVFTLSAAALLSALGLPDDLLRNIAIGVVFLVGLALLWPWLGEQLSRPFLRLGRRAPGDVGGGFLLGASLGLVFTPCAGPVIGAVATLAATRSFSFDAVAITLAYALGAGLVLLGLAFAGRRGLALPSVRRHAPLVRRALGGAVVVTAGLMAWGVDAQLRTNVPEYTRALQRLETSAEVSGRIEGVIGPRSATAVMASENDLDDFGPAPEFAGIESWLNTEPLTLDELRGKVVVIDFWTYSCINCLRTLPYLKRWDEAYRDKGLVLVGVHSPEFAFERVPSNVEDAVERLGVRYPVALDNEFDTWTAWGNRYWPAKYFVDRAGNVRYAHFGEGDYEGSEEVIRTLLAEPGLPDPVSGEIDGERAGPVGTPESYLGYARIERFASGEIARDREEEYAFPATLGFNEVAYSGRWTVEAERTVAGDDARLRLNYTASEANLVLGTDGPESGTVEVFVDGEPQGSVEVTRDDIYRLVSLPGDARERILELHVSPGVAAYAFTFG